MSDNLLSVGAVATKLGVTEQCVRNWITADRIKAVKLGGVVRISPAELDRIMAEGLNGEVE